MRVQPWGLILLVACQPVVVEPAHQPVAEAAVAKRALLEHEILLTGGATADQPLPLLVAIHGMGSRPERFAGAFENMAVPARVILPLAPHPTASGGGSWFGFRVDDPDREAFGRRVYEAADQVVDLMSWAEGAFPTCGEPVITGFSQGGMVSFAVAATWPDAIGAAVPVGGDMALTLVPVAAPADPPPVIAFHGDADEVVPIGPVREAVGALDAAGYDAALHSYADVGHSISPAMRSDWHAAIAAQLGSCSP